MSDVKCPYCGTEQEVNHDDGYGYAEDEDYEQACTDCGKDFKFTTSVSIIYSYTVHCQDGDHDMKPFGNEWPDMYECSKCDFFEKRKAI